MTLAIPSADPAQSFLRVLAGVDRASARQWFERLLDAAAAGQQLWSDDELIDRYLAQCSRTGSAETIAAYRREIAHLRSWLAEHHPGVPLRMLDPSVAEDAIAHLRALVDAGAMAPRTFNRRAACWSSLWRWASEPCRSGVTGFVRSIWARRLYYAVDKQSRPHTESELTGLLGTIQAAAIAGNRTARRDVVLVRAAYLLGCRVSELRHLRWSDIERLPDGGLVTIRRGKGGKSRTIRISLSTLDLLESLGRGEPDAWLFPSNRSDGPLTRQAIGDRLARWGRLIGVHCHPHRLRHSHATNAIRAGVDVFTLMATLGHASTATTSNYVKANPATSSSLCLG